jgi:hypothetical protein
MTVSCLKPFDGCPELLQNPQFLLWLKKPTMKIPLLAILVLFMTTSHLRFCSNTKSITQILQCFFTPWMSNCCSFCHPNERLTMTHQSHSMISAYFSFLHSFLPSFIFLPICLSICLWSIHPACRIWVLLEQGTCPFCFYTVSTTTSRGDWHISTQ